MIETYIMKLKLDIIFSKKYKALLRKIIKIM